MINKTIVIGIDGMDYGYVMQHIEQLPYLSNIALKGIGTKLYSVFPADSIPSWITIFTGMTPDEHGIVRSIDYLNKNYKSFDTSVGAFRGKTFWDIASKNGKRVCIINPFMAYPIWPINGIMVSGPVFIDGNAQYFPEYIPDKYGYCPVLGGSVDFPTKKTLYDFIEKCRRDTLELASYALNIFKNEESDLYFVTFLTLDRLQHFLWRYTDVNDPTFPKNNPYRHVILEFYKLFDQIVGDYYKNMVQPHNILIISDHGHGMRFTKSLNLNDYLRCKGYLKSETGSIPQFSRSYWVEKAKQFVLQALFKFDLEDMTYKIAKLLPNRKRLKSSEHIINKNASFARLSDFGGSGPYGGIEISNGLKGEERDVFISRLISELHELNDSYNKTLFNWILPRKEMFCKEKAIVYPDIIFELNSPFGISWDLYLPLITRNPFHKKISGGHTPNGILFSNIITLDKKERYNVSNIKNIVLESLNIHENR